MMNSVKEGSNMMTISFVFIPKACLLELLPSFALLYCYLTVEAAYCSDLENKGNLCTVD